MMRLLFILLALQISLASCSQDGRVTNNTYGIMLKALLDHSVPEMAVSEVDTSEGLTYVDARSREEFEVSHLKGAIWIGYDDFDASRVDDLSKADTILVYCSVGYRSEKIAEQMEELGFAHVYNLYGGIFEWKNQGHSVVNPNGEITEEVHAFDKNWGRWLKEGIKVYE